MYFFIVKRSTEKQKARFIWLFLPDPAVSHSSSTVSVASLGLLASLPFAVSYNRRLTCNVENVQTANWVLGNGP